MDTFIDSIVDSKPRRLRKSRVLRCTNCGRENGRQRTYCTRCGTVLRKSKKAVAGKPAAGTRISIVNEAMLIAVLLLLIAVVYLVYSSRQSNPGTIPVLPSQPVAAPRDSSPMPSRGRPDETAFIAQDALPQSTDSAPVLRHYDPANLFSDGVPAPARPVKKPASTGVARSIVPPMDTEAIDRSAPPPAAVEPAPPVRVTEAPRPTTRQMLHSAMEQCAGDFLSRFVCEQKARVRYCEGQWGQWAECPGMPTLERGTGG